jgi:DNA-binding response OmpR family regulator
MMPQDMASRPEVAGGGAGAGPILVVEDDRPTRELLGTVLADEHLTFHLTATGHEAMEYAKAQPPSLVVLDMHLPTVQGEAVATAMRIQFGPALPILAMSASDERAAAQRLGAFDFLPKPFEITDFVAKVMHGLELSRRPQELRARSDYARRRLRHVVERHEWAFKRAVEDKPPQQNTRAS